MPRNLTGKLLNKLWCVGAKHAVYREDGKWYHQLINFPGALFDGNGYIVFASAQDYQGCSALQIKQDVHVPHGISSIPGYVRVSEGNWLQAFSQKLKETTEGGDHKHTEQTQFGEDYQSAKTPKAAFFGPSRGASRSMARGLSRTKPRAVSEHAEGVRLDLKA